VDFEEARDAIIQNKVSGEVLRDRIYKIPKIMAASLIITGKTHTLGKHVRDLVKDRVEEKRKEMKVKREREIGIYKKNKSESDAAIANNANKASLMEWNVKDLKSVCMFEKMKEDGKLPTKKRELCNLYKAIMERKGCDVVIDKVCASADVEENDIKPPVVDDVETTLNDEINVSV
jgi:histone acetyltransferase (RNA polymerase elongator complex component)